jgi:hypothetical protein
VVACLDRDPRKRPNSAAVVAAMAPFIGLEGHGHDAGSASLPGAALTLMAEYRRDPRPSAGAAAGAAEDATFGSHPVPGTAGASPAGRGAASRWGGSRHGRTRGAQAAGPPGRVKQRRWRPLLMLAAAVAAAAVLITSGAVIGASIAGKPPPVPLPPPAQQPPAALAALPPGKRGIVMNQPAGDSRTSFVVFGGGWVPGSHLTVTLAGVGASPVHPVADSAGTFNYAINQTHEFFRGGLPPRTYHVIVTAPGGARAEAAFTVNRS